MERIQQLEFITSHSKSKKNQGFLSLYVRAVPSVCYSCEDRLNGLSSLSPLCLTLLVSVSLQPFISPQAYSSTLHFCGWRSTLFHAFLEHYALQSKGFVTCKYLGKVVSESPPIQRYLSTVLFPYSLNTLKILKEESLKLTLLCNNSSETV